MSRLIDADKLINKLKEYTRTNNVEFNGACRNIIEVVKEQPIAFDVDEVVEQIEEIGDRLCNSVKCNKNCADCEHGCLMRGITEAIKAGGIDE